MIPGMEQALATFITESKELLQDMEENLLCIEEAGTAPDNEQLNAIFRAVHTIKGSAGLFGFDDVVKISHATETILDRIRIGECNLDKELITLLLNSSDLIDVLIDFADKGTQPSGNTKQRLRALFKKLQVYQKADELYLEANSSGGSTGVIERDLLQSVSPKLWHITFRPEDSVFQDGLDPLSFVRYLTNLGEIESLTLDESSLDKETEFDPERCYLNFEIDLLTCCSKQDILDVFDFILSDADIQITPPDEIVRQYIQVIQQLSDKRQKLGEILVNAGALTARELTQVLDIQARRKAQKSFAPPIGTLLTERGNILPDVLHAAIEKQKSIADTRIYQDKTLRVEASKLDQLIDQVGEMVITGSRAHLLIRETGNVQLIEVMGQLERLVENVRDSSLKLRMVQIGGTFRKFKRVVRDIAEELGKKVSLEIKGSETELDKTFVEKIGDPLMHIVRNAIDHGIELPNERLAKGKPEVGSVLLNSYHESGSIVIEVCDDGAGIDTEKVRQQAIREGLITKSMRLSNKELRYLIFEPGFSTAELVTSISGRGVGMDVVRRNIDSLHGSIELESEAGKGCIVRIRLPLTLSIIDGFMFQVDNAHYVIPQEMVLECIEMREVVTEDELKGKNYLNLRGETLPFIRMRQLFGLSKWVNHHRESLIVVQSGSLRAGLVVDWLKGEYQTVVKPIGRLFDGVKGISGATILGSGEVAVILDVYTLIKSVITDYETTE